MPIPGNLLTTAMAVMPHKDAAAALFDISEQYSDVYHRFLKLDLSERPAIRGQLEGPIGFGMNVLDQDKRPIL